MRDLLIATALLCCSALTAAAQSHPDKHADEHADKHSHEQAHTPQQQQAANVRLAPGEVVRRGEPLGDSPAVKFADVLKEPAKYEGKRVVVEGVVERVCQTQGCWMELAPEKGARGVRVAMKDHAFFVPFNAAGLRARVEGTINVKTLSKADADHYEKEGAKLTRNPDGTANEISFVATGVELRK
ncbi:MAG: DUF4920 domain-containing protein [Acidobacteria bacterium]|nr:DUF4920 domain-containing protein [Acidobacteriota bacterium]MCA1641360.1 DUF4920 domain-containing protein [Acidobacteriota bacterium]